MKKLFLIFGMLFLGLEVGAEGQESAPLRLVRTITLSPDVKGHFDHFEVDLKGGRLFATPESYKAVLVFDFKTGELIRTIGGIGKPHAVLYREDLNRISWTVGIVGDIKNFAAKTNVLL